MRINPSTFQSDAILLRLAPPFSYVTKDTSRDAQTTWRGGYKMASIEEVVSMDGGELREDGGEWTVVGEGETGGGRDGFVSAVNVWIHRPHVVNKRVSCAVVNNGDIGEGVVRLEREIIPKSSGHDIGNDTVLIGEWEGRCGGCGLLGGHFGLKRNFIHFLLHVHIHVLLLLLF